MTELPTSRYVNSQSTAFNILTQRLDLVAQRSKLAPRFARLSGNVYTFYGETASFLRQILTHVLFEYETQLFQNSDISSLYTKFREMMNRPKSCGSSLTSKRQSIGDFYRSKTNFARHYII